MAASRGLRLNLSIFALCLRRVMRRYLLLVSPPVLLLEPEVLFVFGRSTPLLAEDLCRPPPPAVLLLCAPVLLVFRPGAPLLAEDLGRPALLGVLFFAGFTFLSALVLCVPPRPRPPHLQVLPGDVHPDEAARRRVPP